jgi:DNA-directed RNA polymerase subunit beta
MRSPEQTQSIQRLHANVMQVLQEKFPYDTPNGYSFNVSNVRFVEPDDSHEAQTNFFNNDETMDTIVRADFTVKKDGKEVFSPLKNLVLVRLPHISDRGTYIVKGNETVMLNRMDLRPGVYIHDEKSKSKSLLIQAEVRAGRQRFVVVFDTLKPSLSVEKLKMDFNKTGTSKMNALDFLRVIGATEDEIHTAIGNDTLYQQLTATSGKSVAVKKIYESMNAKPFPGVEAAKQEIGDFITNKLTFDASAQGVNKATLGEAYEVFDKQAFLATIKQMMQEHKVPGSTPDTDDFRFKEISNGEDVLGTGFATGIDNWINRVLKPYSLKQGTRAAVRPQQWIKVGVEGVMNTSSGYAELADVANPLALLAAKQKVTILGKGGLTRRSAGLGSRDLQDTGFAKIDPIETPQSSALGLNQHLSKDAIVKNGRIYSAFYRVQNGVVDKTVLITDLDPHIAEYEAYIAFNDPKQLTQSGGSLKLKGNSIRARHHGDFVTVEPAKITYIDKSPSSVLGYSAGLIPFGAHNDGARMLMGANMQGQAMSLRDAEAPIVQSLSDEGGRTIEEDVADKASFLLRSTVDGKVHAIDADHIDIKKANGEIERIKKLNYFTTGKMGGYINHKPVVSVGDDVKTGSLLADGWMSKNGQLALGKNVTVAYMPYEGYNFEDGVVVARSVADDMASEEVKPLDIPFEDPDVVVGDIEVKRILNQLGINSTYLSKLDEHGIIKKGEDIAVGDILVGAIKRRVMSEKENVIQRLLYRPGIPVPANEWVDASKRAEGYQKGKVIEVRAAREGTKFMVNLKLLSFKPMEEGDKIAGRHGNKGIITKILNDDEMPQTPDGKPVGAMFSPLAIPSRKNIGQLLEVNAGLYAQKKGLANFKVNNFDPSERKRVMDGLEEIGIPDGKMELFNPVTGKNFENKITVGPMYIMKLKHKVADKITARSNIEGKLDDVTLSPRKTSGSIEGERHNPQSVGGMEFWSLTSAGAVHNIHEMTTLKSDGGGDKEGRKDIFSAIRNGQKIKDPLTPQTLYALRDKLYGVGLHMSPLKDGKDVSFDESFNSLMLQPAKKSDLEKLNPLTVTQSKGVEVFKGIRSKGGLYDPEIFGEKGDQWGKIELGEPLPNPMFLQQSGARPYEAMLFDKKLTNSKIRHIVEDGAFVVMDPKGSKYQKYDVLTIAQVIEMEKEEHQAEVDTGPSALNALLKEVDLKEALHHAEGRLATAKKAAQRSDAENHIRVLANALEKGLAPEDFLMHYIPVLPEKYRPLIQRDNHYTEDGLTHLYQKAMKTDEGYNLMIEKLQKTFSHPNFAHIHNLNVKDIMLPETYAEAQRDKYTALKYVVGVGDSFKDKSKNKEYHGIMSTISSKEGFLREDMQSKMQDFSGRSVITVDPTLDLDEVGLPQDLAKVMFKPHIQGYLKRKGYNENDIKLFTNSDSDEFRNALYQVAEVQKHPVILNRQPSLHRHSAMAFFPRIRWNGDKIPSLSIGLNPLVTTAYNADFDGDQMAVHLPITQAAKDEAVEKMMPSQNLLNPTNNSFIMDLKHEMQLGIYYMTANKENDVPVKRFRSLKELTTAYERGDVHTHDPVELNGVKSTVGKHLFNQNLPDAYKDYANNVDMSNKKIDGLMEKIIHSDHKGLGPVAATETLNKLRNISFKVSTLSGLSIGVNDFQPILDWKVKEADNLAALADAALKENEPKLYASAMQDERLAAEQYKSSFIKKQITDAIKDGKILDKDSPINIMMASGARGTAGQNNAMAGNIGVGKAVTNIATRPVNTSHLEGLSPDQFWDLSADSRKGIYDKSIATQEPGALTRQIWMANKHTVISEHDCGDRTGIVLNMSSDTDRRALRGRVILEAIRFKEEDVSLITRKPIIKDIVISVTNRPISTENYERVKSAVEISGTIRVRSPLTCKSTLGICQMCYGSKAGGMNNDFVPIGEAIGSIASQALGEPSQQAIMKTFHTGAGNSKTHGAFERIKQILEFTSINEAHKAVLAKHDGIVSAIDVHPETKHTTVHVGDTSYKLGLKPLGTTIREGAPIMRGDSFTMERQELPNNDFTYHTFRDPKEVLELQGVQGAHDYLLNSLNDALTLGDIKNTDRRHLEVVVGNTTNKVHILDGGTTPFLRERHMDRKTVEAFNVKNMNLPRVQMEINYATRFNVIGCKAAVTYDDRNTGQTIVRKGEAITSDIWDKLNQSRYRSIMVEPRMATYTPLISGVKNQDPKNDPDWLNAAAHESANRAISYGAATGSIDGLSNPLTRQMTGLIGNFGSAFHDWKDNLKEKLHFFF